MNTLIEAKGLVKEFDGTCVLKGIDVCVNKGEFVAIMGQSGSGKSTLLYNISGMDRATSGSITFEGKEISQFNDEQMSDLRLTRMGFIFQQSHLLKTLSIFDNIVLPGFKAKRKTRDEVISDATALMKRTEIDTIASHDIKKVSGGQLQRAAICRALINQPEIIFGDEPTGALNSKAAKEVMDIINEIHEEGTTILLVTHDANVAARADRVIFLTDGVITDEINLGSYEENEMDNRRDRLMEWLIKQGF